MPLDATRATTSAQLVRMPRACDRLAGTLRDAFTPSRTIPEDLFALLGALDRIDGEQSH